MQDALSIIEAEFRRRGALTAGELAAVLGVSQSTVSRLLARVPRRRLLRLGRARASRYAMVRELGSLGSTWPLYEIDARGQSHLVGQFHALNAKQWCLQQDAPWEALRGSEFRDGLYPDLPWFLDDLRPQGFMGRAFVRTYGGVLGLPTDPRSWQADDVVLALLRHGHDLQGAFVLGAPMLGAAQECMLSDGEAIPFQARSEVYPAHAESALGGEWPGSSAAGEQPKFTARIRDTEGGIRHALVKFSGRAGRLEDQRWADLLAAEHLAAVLLTENGIAAARTGLLEAGGRRFLEVTRFDRIGAHGRRGLTSLAALDAAFFGQLQTPWTDAADRLLDGGWFSAQDAERLKLLWWFGILIGNTDMHYGNVSLFLRRDLPLSLAPSYDMLPMLYRPDAEGGLPARRFAPVPPPPESIAIWSAASAMAETYWTRAAASPLISKSFRQIAAKNAETVARYRRQFR